MTRQTSNYFVTIYGNAASVTERGDIQGGSLKFETKGELATWITQEGVKVHPNPGVEVGDYGILPDGRAVQIFHGHTESLVTKVEIG